LTFLAPEVSATVKSLVDSKGFGTLMQMSQPGEYRYECGCRGS